MCIELGRVGATWETPNGPSPNGRSDAFLWLATFMKKALDLAEQPTNIYHVFGFFSSVIMW